MSMRILFTRSGTPLSRAIRAVTKEPVSHCAIQLGELVVHSNLYGVHLETLHYFQTHSEIVYEVDIPDNIEGLHNSLDRDEGKWYDIGALLYLGLRYVIPCLPKKNLWQCSGMYLCTEFVTEVINGEADSLVTPYQLYVKLTGVNK